MGSKGDLLVKRGFRKNYRQEPMEAMKVVVHNNDITKACLLYTSPSPRDMRRSRMPSSA